MAHPNEETEAPNQDECRAGTDDERFPFALFLWLNSSTLQEDNIIMAGALTCDCCAGD